MNLNSAYLPNHCPQFRATGRPGDERLLENYIGVLPGLTQERFDSLANLAFRAQGGGSWRQGPGITVLRVRDLIRQTRSGLQALHPRVVQVVPFDTLDQLLEGVRQVFDAHEANIRPYC